MAESGRARRSDSGSGVASDSDTASETFRHTEGRFRFADLEGETYPPKLLSATEPTALEAQIRRLIDPAQATETLHWGRNYLYVVDLETPSGSIPAVVKQFRNRGAKKRLERRFRGSKAERSWRVARTLVEADLPTAEPLVLIESRDPEGPSWFVSRRLETVTEVRYLLRAANAGGAERAAEEFAQFPLDEVIERMAGLIARLHGQRIWFRDMTSGNVLLRRGEEEDLELFLVDLNRARLDQRMSTWRRTGDLSRMPILRPADQRRFLNAYWEAVRGRKPGPWAHGLYLAFHHGFLWKNALKKRLRGGRKALEGRLVARSTHAHIPDAPTDAGARDKIVWDHLSDQPHGHTTPMEKLAVRAADARSHAASAIALLASMPRILARYRQIKRELYSQPIPFEGAGIAVRPLPEDPEGLLGLIEELGAKPVLIRLHPWDDDDRHEHELATELVARGHELTFALPQNRELVKDPARWRASVERIAERFRPLGRHFVIGQAVNRSKWGVWNPDEYVDLALAASEVLRAGSAGEGVQILGPSVIDFEHHATASILNLKRPGLHFDAVSSLLYVDRRGAPENAQAGFDTVGKIALLKAIAETSRNSTGRCWITEVNWPLWEGPHSPAGKKVSVDPQTQADYLVRYFLLALTTGLVERVFWWQMIARGYGLAWRDDTGIIHKRPAFEAMKTMLAQLDGATCLGPLNEGEATRGFRFFRPDGHETRVAWSVSEQRSAGDVVGVAAGDANAAAGSPGNLSAKPKYFAEE